jgi:hypothetical protein
MFWPASQQKFGFISRSTNGFQAGALAEKDGLKAGSIPADWAYVPVAQLDRAFDF